MVLYNDFFASQPMRSWISNSVALSQQLQTNSNFFFCFNRNNVTMLKCVPDSQLFVFSLSLLFKFSQYLHAKPILFTPHRSFFFILGRSVISHELRMFNATFDSFLLNFVEEIDLINKSIRYSALYSFIYGFSTANNFLAGCLFLKSSDIRVFSFDVA